jgi:hypothetical protein
MVKDRHLSDIILLKPDPSIASGSGELFFEF